MCLMAMAWGQHPRYPLVLAANRDEFHDRPAAPMDWWPDGQTLAGRDLQAGGTWLGLARNGRIGLLTNVREPGRTQATATSRGGIVPRWLQGDEAFEELQQSLQKVTHNGYNLLALDLAQGQAHWHSNRHGHRHRLPAGLWGLSNAALDTPWPKLRRLKAALHEAIQSLPEEGRDDAPDTPHESLTKRLLRALSDRHQPDDADLPRTGVALDWERRLGTVFIQTPDGRYGTRCSTTVVVQRGKARRCTVFVSEQNFDAQGQPTALQRAQFDCELPEAVA